jgi:hypothetical protein
MRWGLMLQEYNLSIQHIKCKDNCIANVFARVYLEIFRTYQNSRSKLKTCEQLDVFLITYLLSIQHIKGKDNFIANVFARVG